MIPAVTAAEHMRAPIANAAFLVTLSAAIPSATGSWGPDGTTRTVQPGSVGRLGRSPCAV
jgi:hypothetical protein